jgi:hypothetical protein
MSSNCYVLRVPLRVLTQPKDIQVSVKVYGVVKSAPTMRRVSFSPAHLISASKSVLGDRLLDQPLLLAKAARPHSNSKESLPHLVKTTLPTALLRQAHPKALEDFNMRKQTSPHRRPQQVATSKRCVTPAMPSASTSALDAGGNTDDSGTDEHIIEISSDASEGCYFGERGGSETIYISDSE